MTWKERSRRSHRFWTQLPPHATLLFFLSVFCLFASTGFIATRGTWLDASVQAVFSGAIALLFAYLGTRGYYRWMGVAILLVVVWPAAEQRWLHASASPAATSAPPGAAAAIALIIVGYMLMVFFISTEGRRYYRLHTQIELAGEIHKALAPALAARLGEFEFAGQSRPSGEVGGDLLDLVGAPGSWLAYVADVSGHGVAAGVLMGLVKSAARTWLSARGGQDGLLPGLNRTLAELLPPENFVTFAALSPVRHGELRLAAAGHPPLLHFHAASGQVSQLRLENFPLGLFPTAEFSSATLTCEPGDVLALYTDGIAEVFDAHGREFGDQSLETVLRQAAARPLPEAAEQIAAAARAFGAQTDDQTVLLVRCVGD
ncbi:MAG: PP2C family protein-serine/threonine phosphatase [Terriglobales bacterium]